ncbi:MAG: hypothetical protein L3K15_07070 [Thermoplasmata archaeon]|nr:hypothetical protein [Thermoplasmata archaeon]
MALGLSVLMIAVPLSLSAGPASAPSAALTSHQVRTAVNTCGTAGGPTPAALYIPNKIPVVALSAGDAMTVEYEFQVQAFATAVAGEAVHIPSVFAKFPLSNGTTLQFFFLPRVIVIHNGSWTPTSLATDRKAIHASWTFATTGSSTLSTELLAISATNSAYGNLTLAFRWIWSIDQTSNGHGFTNGTWTKPTAHIFPPSIFEPAPWVGLLSHNGPTVTIGTPWIGYLVGAISSVSFLIELEYPSGDVFATTTEPTPAGNSTPFKAHILMMSNDNTLSPTKALVHIHDHCGAILYSLSVVAVYPSSAVLNVDVAPSACGPVTFNGTAYANRSAVALSPSTASYPISVGTCSGHSFFGWEGNLGVDADPVPKLTSSVVVSANGTLTAKFL